MSETKPATGKNFSAQFTTTFGVDRRLFAADVFVNLAYADTLFDAGILTRQESERIKQGLQTILKRADYDRNYFTQDNTENVHSFIETRLIQLVGETGAKIGTGRNRRQQTETALRVWLRGKITETSRRLRNLQGEILRLAESSRENTFAGGAGNKISWAEWCLNYYTIWQTDRERLDEVWRRVNVFPMVANASDDAAEEIDFEDFARRLRFEGVAEIFSDAAFKFDFAVEFVNAFSLVMLHLAALGEDLCEYAKNSESVDVLRVVSGKTGRLLGLQNALNLILANFRFNQSTAEILEIVFDSFDTTEACLEIISGIVPKLDLTGVSESLLTDRERERIENALENARDEWRFEE